MSHIKDLIILFLISFVFVGCSVVNKVGQMMVDASDHTKNNVQAVQATQRESRNTSPKNETGRFADTWRDHSAGPTGCLAEDILIWNSKKNLLFGKFNWTAVCNGKEYRCMWVEGSGPATCNHVPSKKSDIAENKSLPKADSTRSTANSSQGEKPTVKYETGRFADTYRDYSAGATGCLAEDILISNSKKNLLFGKFNWTATCQGEEYRCMWVEGSGPATCNHVPSKNSNTTKENLLAKSDSSQPSTNSSQDMVVLQVQNKLLGLGYNPGPADGIMGSKTINALKKYQQDNNLPVTGNADKVTADNLFKNNTAQSDAPIISSSPPTDREHNDSVQNKISSPFDL
jgi:hypothetical protein